VPGYTGNGLFHRVSVSQWAFHRFSGRRFPHIPLCDCEGLEQVKCLIKVDTRLLKDLETFAVLRVVGTR